ncbi:MAG: hypothetical protein WA432_01975, partial [Candidatus Babeliaceae bacterium]
MRTARLNALRTQLESPNLNDRDRGILQAQLDDMKAHPFETNELGSDVNALKAPKPTLSREEAEANVEKRKEARTARFTGGELPTEAPGTEEPPFRLETDKVGVRWAVQGTGPDEVRVSIPKGVAVDSIQEYATEKLAEQTEAQRTIREAPQPTETTHVTERELPDGTIVHTQEGTSEVHQLERELIARGRITEEDIPRLRRAALDRAPQYRGQEYYEAALRKYLSEPAELPTEAPSLMEKAPPGGFTEADKVPRIYRKTAEPDYEKEPLTQEEYGRVVGMKALQSPEMAQHFPTYEELRDAMPGRRSDENLSDVARRVMHENAESGTLPPEQEVPSDVEPTESGLGTEQQPVGAAGEGPLEEVAPEDARGAGEERGTPPEGGGGRGADAERLAGRGEQPRGGSPGGLGTGEGEISVPAERGGRTSPGREPGQHVTGNRAGNDYRITDRDAIGTGGERTKYRANVAAIRTLKQIEREGRLATPEEQQILVKYVGWGGIAPNQLFNSDTKGGKNWADEYNEIKELLSDEEYTRARASTTNAHYTSVPVVKGMWDGIRRLGFRDGKLLEPSAGIGHFIGLEPGDLANATQRTAVELDQLSGRILKQLYQSADVRIQNYGDFKAPNDTYDIAMGNVPFGKIIVNDPDYNKHKLSIHNYFITKTLDKLRPGGIAALITSSHTLDSMENKHRALFANRADLIGAIRLPNTAFKGNAGTEVTTDILFFKKREPGEKYAGEPFQNRQEITSPEGHQIPVNEYFAKHPEMMLGDMELAGTMRRAGEPTLLPRADENLADALGKAVARLPEDVMGERKIPDSVTAEATADAVPDYKEVKPYGLTIKNGRVYRRIGDAIQHEPDFPKKNIQTLKEMLDVRDATRELLQAEAKDRPQSQLADLRRRLNNSYDKFVKKNGIIHSQRNEKAMHADPDLPFLLSLEDYDKDTKTATKAAIFRQRVVNPTPTITAADNAKDAMLVSLAEKGRLDFDRMAELTGKPTTELQNDLKSQGLVFQAPDGHWETADRYLSGNVRKKLAEAEAAAAEKEEFRPNVEALRSVIPEDVPPSKIFLKLGSPWIPNRVLKSFVSHILGSPERGIELLHDDQNATYDLGVHYGIDPVKNRTQWGTAKASAEWLLQQGLNLRAPTIYEPGDEPNKRVVNPTETAAAEQKLNDL